MTQADEQTRAPAEVGVGDVAAWMRNHAVLLVALLMICLQLCVAGAVLAHSYFRQQDFFLIDWALNSHLGWQFLASTYQGHFEPGGLAVVWVLSKISVYDWLLTSLVTMVLLAGACLALLRLLARLFGTRPAILVPLVIYLFTPLMLPGLTYWTPALQWLPAQIALFMALAEHVSYVRDGRLRHAAAATAWIAFGLAFDEVSVLIPVLLLALTSAFLLPGGWARATVAALRTYWRGWTAYLTLAAIYLGIYLHQLASAAPYSAPASDVLKFGYALIRAGLVPGEFGGPWHWTVSGGIGGQGDYAYAAGFTPLTQLSWLLAILVVAVSLAIRRRAWRAWVVLAAWTVVAGIAPVFITGSGISAAASTLGHDLQYLAMVVPVLAVCLGLAFLPVAGEQDDYRMVPARDLKLWVAGGLVGVFLIGSAWSYAGYETDTSSAGARSYIATARAAMAAVPPGTVIADQLVPDSVELPWFGGYADSSSVVGPLTVAAHPVLWTTAPEGVIESFMAMDGTGRLWPAQVVGRTAAAPASVQGCWRIGPAATTLRIPGSPLYNWTWTIELPYFGPAATMAVTFGGQTHDVQLLSGAHAVYVTASGSGSSVQVQLLASGPPVCVTALTVGNVVPSALGTPVPAVPLPG
jgi:hypothetical protein